MSSDYTVSFDSAALSGIERDVDQSDTKADLQGDIALATPEARMFAVTTHNIPQRVFDSESSLQNFLEQEMRRRVDLELDQHVIDVNTTSTPASGSPSGSDLIEKGAGRPQSIAALAPRPACWQCRPVTAPTSI